MKNITVYIGTIKKCLDLDNYKKHGDKKERMAWEERTITTATIGHITTNYTEPINKQAIIIKSKYDFFYQFKLTNTFIDNLGIIFDNPYFSIPTKPEKDDDIFIDETTLIPYYENQPKSLSLKKLKRDILMDPRIKTGIEQ